MVSSRPSVPSRQGSVEDNDVSQSTSTTGRRTRKRPAAAPADIECNNGTIEPLNDVQDHQTLAAIGSGTSVTHRNEVASGSSRSRQAAFESPNDARHRIMSVLHRQPAAASAAHTVNTASGHGERTQRSPVTEDAQLFSPHLPQSPLVNLGPTLQVPQSQYSSYFSNTSPSRNTRSSNTVLVPAENNRPSASTTQATASFNGSRGMTRSLSNLTNQSLSTQNSNMSPPRPTRSLPRRNASVRTLNRPVLSSNNPSSSSQVLRARSASNSTILSTSSSNANIMASGSSFSRQNMPTGCGPFSGAFDPSLNPSSGTSTPRTPLAEIPIWLADMRSESRRSSSSSASFMDRDDWLPLTQPGSRHTRTASMNSSPSSPGATRTDLPAGPFRRSQRARHSQQGDENARLSPELYSYDVEETNDTSNFSSNTALIPSVPPQGQASSPAMSTRSRTLNRTSSARRPRRLTSSLSAPILTLQDSQHSSESSQPDLLGLAVEHSYDIDTRTVNRSSSRTRSPSRATRALRRRSVVTEPHQDDSSAAPIFGPHPRPLPPLRIPSASAGSDLVVTDSSAGLLAEPISPSTFSEMTSMTQGSTAAESSSSFGPPSTPLATFLPHELDPSLPDESQGTYRLRSSRSNPDTTARLRDKNVVQDDDPSLLDDTIQLSTSQSR